MKELWSLCVVEIGDILRERGDESGDYGRGCSDILRVLKKRLMENYGEEDEIGFYGESVEM